METKKQIYIIASAFLLLCLFFVLFFVFPVFSDIDEESRNLISQKSSVRSLEYDFNFAENFQKKYQEYEPNFKKIDDLSINAQSPVVFIKFLEKTAVDYGVKVGLSSPSFFNEGNFSFANFNLSVAGSFSEVIKFLKVLESGQYPIRIQNLNIVDNTGSGNNLESKKSIQPVKSVKASALIKVFAGDGVQ